MIMNRRAFSAAMAVGAVRFADLDRRHDRKARFDEGWQRRTGARSFRRGSCWSEVIARLQAVGLNATAVNA